MSRPGYDKYLNKLVDANSKIELDIDSYDFDVREIISKARKMDIKHNGVNYGKIVGFDFIMMGLERHLGRRELEYIESRFNVILDTLKKHNIVGIYKGGTKDIRDGGLLLEKLAATKYKYIINPKNPSTLLFSDLKAANAFLKEETNGDELELKNYKIKGFTPKITDSFRIKDSEPNLIISALEKDFKDKVKSDSLLKAKYINFYSFFNLTRLNDRSSQFLSAFNETIETNKSTIKSLIQKLGVELFSIQTEYVTKAELNLFKFIQKELGFKFYSKHGRETYISNNAEIIRRIQNDIHQYGDVTSTNVK